MRQIAVVVALLGALLVLPGAAAARDGDGDKLPDRWEKRHGLSTAHESTHGDADRDGLSNREEFRCHTKPRAADSDRDHRDDADEDPDRDRVDNGNEMAGGTRPFDRDSDDDEKRDGREDPDRDRLNNAGEDATSNDPKDPDTDDDGVKDGEERAGTIASFQGGVLTIDLANGDRVKGKVTDATEIECESEDAHEDSDHLRGAIATRDGDDEDQPSRKGEDVDEEDGDNNDLDDGDEFDGEHEDGDRKSACGPAELEPPAAVHEAELKLTSDGPVFAEIELVK